MLSQRERLAVVIVSYGNPQDIARCLASLATSDWRHMEIFICENSGFEGFESLLCALMSDNGLLVRDKDCREDIDRPGQRLAQVVKCRFAGEGIVVRLAAAVENLGYGGGVNAWLERIMTHPGWEAVLVLNPDTAVEPCSLSKLMAKEAEGYGMVGAALVFDDDPHKIINYGLSWSRFTGRVIAVGRNAPAAAVPPAATIAALDAVSGACVLVSRAFVEEAGLMTEDYFLYMEDLDWGRRRGSQRIGFAQDAVVRHVGGTSIGSSVHPRLRSRLSVYLTARNNLLYARRCAGWLWIVHALVGLAYALRYILQGLPAAARVTIAGIIDGARGKAGRPEIRLD